MEHDRIELMSPKSRIVAKKLKKNRLEREKNAISKLLSPDRMAKKRRLDRERKANRRSDPIQRQRYNDSQNALYHQSVSTINSDARSTTAIGLDADGGYEETKQNSPSTNNATQPAFSSPRQTGAEVGLAPI